MFINAFVSKDSETFSHNLKKNTCLFYTFILLHLILTWGPVNVGPIGDLFTGTLALAPVRGHEGAGGRLRAGD